MTQHIKIDPITRIEGHLRVDVEVDNGRVSDAWVSSTMWRGMEKILQERDAREAWLFAQRICGVCTTVHAIASVRAVEDALKLQIPANAEYIRNLILIHHALHDHIVHFYQLSALDWSMCCRFRELIQTRPPRSRRSSHPGRATLARR